MDLNIPSVVVRLPGTPSATVVPVAGPPGNDGADGVDGAPGTNGAPGAPGTNGVDGSDGATGPQGPPGNDGADGATGPQGLPGNDGADGAPGATGPQGPPGNDGADGIDGATGPQGIPGVDGIDGIDGADGADGVDLSTDYVSTTPAPPTTGIALFSRHRARRILAMQGPEGLDVQVQPAIFSNKIARATSLNNAGGVQLDGLSGLQNYGNNSSAVQNGSSSFFAAMTRSRFTSVATASSVVGIRSTQSQWFTSSIANAGGMFSVVRFGLNATTVTNRLFAGFSTTVLNMALATTDPSALFNQFGFGADSGDTNLQFMHNDGSGTSTKIDLGSNFPARTAATYFYELRIFVPSGAGNRVFWSAHRLNDGIVVQGGPITTNLPAEGTLLNAHLIHGNGATATAVQLDFQSLYIETDN